MYDFVLNALIAGTIAAIASAIIGYFVVLRSQVFSGHALSHIAFAGAAGAGLIGLAPATGQLIFTLCGAIVMGCLGERAYKSDLAIGVTLSFSLGLGMLFLYLYTSHASQAIAILFGDLLGVSRSLIIQLFIYFIISLLGLACVGKRLLFTSLEPELAEAKGISLRFTSICFFALVAIAVTEASQVVGILLVFTLLISPAACALCCTRSIRAGILLSIALGVATVWLGIFLAIITDWPIPFWISTLSFVSFLLFKAKGLLRNGFFHKRVCDND